MLSWKCWIKSQTQVVKMKRQGSRSTQMKICKWMQIDKNREHVKERRLQNIDQLQSSVKLNI